MARNEFVGWLLGEKIGIVEEVDVDEGEMAQGEYLQVRVTLQVSQLLLRGSIFAIGGGEVVWVCFSYERLPNFCYLCGYLGHGEKECTFVPASSQLSSMKNLPYGMRLRVGGYGDRFLVGKTRDNVPVTNNPGFSSRVQQLTERQGITTKDGGADVTITMMEYSVVPQVSIQEVTSEVVKLNMGSISQETGCGGVEGMVTDKDSLSGMVTDQKKHNGYCVSGPNGPQGMKLNVHGPSSFIAITNKPDGLTSQKWKNISF